MSRRGAGEEEEWSNVSDFEERRRIQNRIAQRKYRANAKNREARIRGHRVGVVERAVGIPSANLSGAIPEISTSPPAPVESQSNPSRDSNIVQGPPGNSAINNSYFSQIGQANSPRSLQMSWDLLLNDNDGNTSRTPERMDVTSPPSEPLPQNWRSAEPSCPSLPLPGVIKITPMLLSPMNQSPGPTRLAQESSNSHHQLPSLDLNPSFRAINHNIDKDNGRVASNEQNGINTGCKDPPEIAKNNAKPLIQPLSSAHLAMVKCAYEQGKAEAIASFEKQQSHLQNKIDNMVGGILETYRLGVVLEIFRDDPDFESQVGDIKTRLESLHRESSRVTSTSPFTLWLEKERNAEKGGGVP